MTDDYLRTMLDAIRNDTAGHVAMPADVAAKIIEDALRFRHIQYCTSYSSLQRRVYLEWSGGGTSLREAIDDAMTSNNLS